MPPNPSPAALRAAEAIAAELSLRRGWIDPLARIIDEQTHVGELQEVLSGLMATYHIADFKGMSNHALAEASELAPAPEYRQECAAILRAREVLAKLQPEGHG